jgi:hypothetical protein
MVYRIESLDAGLEGLDFLALFGAAPAAASTPVSSEKTETVVYSRPSTASTPVAAPKRAPVVTTKPVSAAVPKPAPVAAPKRAPAVTTKPVSAAVPKPAPVAVPKRAPAVTTKPVSAAVSKPTSATRKVTETEVVVTRDVVTTKVTPLDEIASKLKELEIPPNLEREIVIIGNTVFSVIKEHLHLFSKDVVKLEPMDDLPSGTFPAEHYQVRLFVEDGKVLFIEMLRQKTRSERDEFIDDMRQQLQDLSKMGL